MTRKERLEAEQQRGRMVQQHYERAQQVADWVMSSPPGLPINPTLKTFLEQCDAYGVNYTMTKERE